MKPGHLFKLMMPTDSTAQVNQPVKMSWNGGKSLLSYSSLYRSATTISAFPPSFQDAITDSNLQVTPLAMVAGRRMTASRPTLVLTVLLAIPGAAVETPEASVVVLVMLAVMPMIRLADSQ